VRHFSISRFCPQLFALLVLAASLVGSCVTAFSAEVGLAWDAATAPEIVGYRMYYGVVSRSDVRAIDVGNVTTYRVTGLDPDTYWFCVKAYDFNRNETDCSNVVLVTLSPPMYGLREESVSSEPGDAFPAGPYSRNVSENRRSSRPAEEDLFASSFHSVACRLHVPNDSRYPEHLYQHSQCQDCSDG
jgi:hypothetical protein